MTFYKPVIDAHGEIPGTVANMTVLGRESVGDIAGSRLVDKASLPY